MQLHVRDLDFALSCLDAINEPAIADKATVQDALWFSSLVHYFKCFGISKARGQLSPQKVYRGESKLALEAYNYLLNLRNKHIVHDENAWMQALPMAVLNDGTKSYKVEKVVTLATVIAPLEESNYSNLRLLIEKARKWVVAEYDALADQIKVHLETFSYEALKAMDIPRISFPDHAQIDQTRPR